MKTGKKVFVGAMAGALLVAGSVAGTLAYLTSTTDVVNNTFTVGKVEITLDETDVDNSTEGKDRDTANTYKLIPGTTYTKDPIVHVQPGSEESWLFVKVANGVSAVEGETTIADQMEENGWTLVDATNGIWAYAETVNAEEDIPVFETFTVAQNVTNNQITGTITVEACAVQAEGLTQTQALAVAQWN